MPGTSPDALSSTAVVESDRRDEVAPGESGEAPPPTRYVLREIPPIAWTIVGGLVGVLTALWITRHAWGPHVIAGGDITADLVRSDFGIAHLVAHGRIDGWFPRFMLGHQEFLFNGPGVTWATAVIRALTFGTLSNTGAIKVLAIAAIAAEPVAVAYFARSFRIDRVAAALAGILALTATVGFGIGLEGQFVNGLLSHQVGAIPFFLSFGAVLRAYDEPTRKRSIIAAVALAVLAITHLISVMILVVMLPIALLFRLGASQRAERRRGLRSLFLTGCVAIGLAGFWAVPFFVHRDLRGPIVTWGTDPFEQRIAQIMRGQILYLPFVAKLVMLAWVVVLVRCAFGHREHLVFLAVPALYLAISHVTLKYPGPGDISLQLANRGLAYAGIIALVPVAALVALAARRIGEWAEEPALVVVLSIIAIVASVGITVAHSKEGLAGELTPATPAFRAAALQLRTLVPDGARFSLTRDYPAEIERVGVIEPARWLAWASGVDTLNSFNPESSNAGAVAYTADGPNDNQPIDDWLRALRRLGVSDVVVDKPELDEKVKATSLAHAVWTEGPVTIYEVLDDAGGRPPVLLDPGSTRATVHFSRRGPERLSWDIDTATPFVATIAVTWSPKWHATVDGHSARISKTSDGIMQVAVPAGRHTVRFSYGSDFADHLGVLLTLVTLGWLVSIPVRRYRSARPKLGPERVPTTGTGQEVS
jgi:hypothetical protein